MSAGDWDGSGFSLKILGGERSGNAERDRSTLRSDQKSGSVPLGLPQRFVNYYQRKVGYGKISYYHQTTGTALGFDDLGNAFSALIQGDSYSDSNAMTSVIYRVETDLAGQKVRHQYGVGVDGEILAVEVNHDALPFYTKQIAIQELKT